MHVAHQTVKQVLKNADKLRNSMIFAHAPISYNLKQNSKPMKTDPNF